ncbi:MarR family transcriptional regulator [Streptomyces sp. CB01881]|uniref:MarR family winged helix-turn-helix transcriptional regulator n=1 Tax=Streptomyces sp. CB01881 TaxID=2078691 RepID=UPI000CDC8615|nr:MarR family transcriptional regulator [Streptomyces sp. CB01881]AUY52712.1 MarR family transcriptional regulator [Streptomyces sp. CB01881]TYC70430.1 MarR family transcriptional regulator [Streptomyces sp. CB01881]
MTSPRTAPRATPKKPSAAPELARLEVALSAAVRWSESRHVRAEVARLSDSDLSPSALRLLEHFDVAGAMRVSDLADCLHVDVSTVSLQLRPLKAGNLVGRRTDPADGRSGLIAITPDGRRVLERVRAARCELLAEAFAQALPGELGRAADVLVRVQDHMLAAMAEAGYVTAPD